jgi:hypothetical protein
MTPVIVFHPTEYLKVAFGELAWRLRKGGPLATEDADRCGD